MKLSTQIFLGFSVVIALSIINSYVNNLLSQKVNTNTAFVNNSESVIRNSTRIHKSIIEMQSAFRGFLLTEDDDFLLPYYSGLKEIPRLFDEQRKLVTAPGDQRIKLDSIYDLHKEWVSYANELITSKKELLELKPSKSSYQQLFDNKLRKHVGKNLNEQISDKFQEFDRYEYRLRLQRRSMLLESIKVTETFSVVFIILTITIGLISSLYIVNLISRRISQMVKMAEDISGGNFAVVVDTRSDELTSLSKSLNLMSSILSRNIKELEKRNSELKQFAYVVSHDLKAPIRGIYNVIQWIEEDLGNELSAQMRKYLNIIPDRIKRMEDLIHGLLDYARIGREQPLKETVDVGALVQDQVDLIVPKSFSVKISEMPVINTERIRMEQVFSNLISNAVKYNSGADGKISISCKESEDFYEFRVGDNGIGIEPEFHEKIFVIFQTLREKHAQESTGIGLAIVKKIIEDQGCAIRVESALGKGSTFIFTWPKN